jgi:nucleolar protein 6
MVEKLSKRKKKALAFRGKKTKQDIEDDEAKAIPIEKEEETRTGTSSWLGNDIVKGSSTTKRKRKNEPDEPTSPPTKKKPKSSQAPSKKQKPDTQKPPAPKRYIIFLGNLPHQPSSTLLSAIQSHFPVAPKSIRIPLKKTTNAPQGYAFLEFDDSSALEKALRLHHSTLLGRKVNVELTAGGGGKGENRMGKIKVKNESLEEERRTRAEEERKSKEGKEKEKGSTGGIHPDRLKRMQKS